MEFTAEAMRKKTESVRKPLGADEVRALIERQVEPPMSRDHLYLDRWELSEGVRAGLKIAGFTVEDTGFDWRVSW